MDVDEKHSTSPAPQQKIAAVAAAPSAQPKVIKGIYIKKKWTSHQLHLITILCY